MAISLVPQAKKRLKEIIRTVLPQFKQVRFNSEMIILKESWFSKAHKIAFSTFLLETLPKEINSWAQLHDLESPLPYFGNTAEFLLYMNNINENNILSYLWKCYTELIIQQDKEVYASQQKSIVNIVCTRIITEDVYDKVLQNFKHMCNNVKHTITIKEIYEPVLDIVHTSGPIRGSPKLIYPYFARAG